MDKFTNLFTDVSRVTISGIIARESASPRNSDLRTLEENVMKKILWYRDLPLEEENLPKEMSYDQMSFKYKKIPKEEPPPPPPLVSSSSPSSSKLQGTITLPQVEKMGWKADVLFEGPKDSPQQQGGEPAAVLPPLPQPKNRNTLSGVFKAPPPPPSIAVAPSFSTAGYILQSELKPFVLLACLDYLRSR
jgi:hypothetical protein